MGVHSIQNYSIYEYWIWNQIELCLENSVIPVKCDIAVALPLDKKNNKVQFENYGPICWTQYKLLSWIITSRQ